MKCGRWWFFRCEWSSLQIYASEEVSLLSSGEVIVSDKAYLGVNESLEFSMAQKDPKK